MRALQQDGVEGAEEGVVHEDHFVGHVQGDVFFLNSEVSDRVEGKAGCHACLTPCLYGRVVGASLLHTPHSWYENDELLTMSL